MPINPGIEISQEALVISCPVVLLVEGRDEVNFFGALFNHMNPEATIKFIESFYSRSLQCIVKNMSSGVNVEVRDVRGKDNLRYELPAFLNDPNFSLVRSYVIVRDADANASDALSSVQKLLRDHRQPCPTNHACFASSDNNTLTVGVYIMPGDPTGMLEDLCLRSVEDHPIMPHVRSFMEQVQQTMGKEAPKNRSKATVQAFLSGMRNTVSSLGVAAQRRYWYFDNGVFGNLRSFLEQLAREHTIVDIIEQADDITENH